MNKIILLLILSLFSKSVVSQKINDFSKPTENHILIKGTNIYLIPPKDYIESSNFKGFQSPNSQTSMIMVMEIPGPFSEVSKGFNSEMLATKGMKLKNKKEVSINKYKGLILDIDQDANGLTYSKHILIYGNEKSTTMINGIYLENDVENGKIIKNSIETIIVNNSINADPRTVLDYTIDETAGNLILVRIIGNGFLLNRDGKMPTESNDKTTLITDKSFTKNEIKNKKLFCISRIKKLPENYQILPKKGINEIEIDGIKGFELYAKNTENERELVYQVILFPKNGGYFIFFGTYENEKAVDDIKKVILTFKRK